MQAGWDTLADIQVADWQPALGNLGGVVEGVDDIEQCIKIICTTPKGSDFLRPEFGLDFWSYLDFPLIRVTPSVIAAVIMGVTRWEPRINVSNVAVYPDLTANPDGSNIIIVVTWTLKINEGVTAAQHIEIVNTLVTISVGAGFLPQ